MGMLIDGVWTEVDAKKADASGRFERKPAKFRGRVETERGGLHEAGRYALLVAWPCPWCHRTLIVRNIMKLQEYVPVILASSAMGEGGWQIDTRDQSLPFSGTVALHNFYTHTDSLFTGVASVPVLWDRKAQKIVNNESSDIVDLFLSTSPQTSEAPNLLTSSADGEIERVSEIVHRQVNEGVYRAGFATSQSAYNEAIDDIFGGLDELDHMLANRKYLAGDHLSLADVYAFPTLIRFDPVYSVLMRCNLKRITEYKHLFAYLTRLYQDPAFSETVDIDEYRRGYFSNMKKLNPTGIVPAGPRLDFTEIP